MSPPITASFRWSREEFLRSQRLAARHLREGRWFYRITTAIGLVILLSGVVSFHQHTTGWPGFLLAVVLGGMFLATPLLARRAALKLYAQKPDRDREVTWDISEEGVRSKTPLAASENSWAFFQTVLRAREGFLLCPGGRMYHWLPTHAFRDPEDVERFASVGQIERSATMRRSG